MADILKTSPEKMISIAQELKRDIDSLEKTMASIQENIDRLDIEWSGEAQNAFMEQYKETDYYIRQLIRGLNRYSDNLIKISERYKQVEDFYTKGGAILSDDFL